MIEMKKSQKKHLRELAGIAYERDLSRCLEILGKKFDQWRGDEISVWELNDLIHEFHNDIGRELYKTYTMSDPRFPVAFGINTGVLGLVDVRSDCRPLIERLVGSMESGDMH
jgi:hypothetical protein